MNTVDLEKLGRFPVMNALSGETVELQLLWRENTTVLFFLRRFGCQVCRWTAKEVSKLQESFNANQIRLIGIGPERVGLQEFVNGKYFTGGGGYSKNEAKHGNPFTLDSGELYLDESKQSYKELGFKRYNALSIVPAALGKKVRDVVTKANADGVQGNFSGDLLQSGGMLIVSKGGEKVLLHFTQDSPGDHVPLETIMETLGISANVTEEQQPQCGDDACTR